MEEDTREQNLIGLSLSACIRDMAEGVVNPERVKFIVAGTNWKFPEQVEEAIHRYTKESLVWFLCAEKAAKILRDFVERKKIIQPRNYDFDSHNVALGWWAKQGHLDEL